MWGCYVIIIFLFSITPSGCRTTDVNLHMFEQPNEFQNELELQNALNSEISQYRRDLNRQTQMTDSEIAAEDRVIDPLPMSNSDSTDDDGAEVDTSSHGDVFNFMKDFESTEKTSRYKAPYVSPMENNNEFKLDVQRSLEDDDNMKESDSEDKDSIDDETHSGNIAKTLIISKGINTTINPENCSTVTQVSKKCDIFLGTNLFDGNRKNCFSIEDVALLAARKDFELLIPKSFPNNLLTEPIVTMLMEYFNGVNKLVHNVADDNTRRLSQKAFLDSFGGYLRYYLVPVAKVSYYAGTIELNTVEKIVALYQRCKVSLNTNGNGWRTPIRDVLYTLKRSKIKPLRIKPCKSNDIGAGNCAALDMNCDDKEAQNDLMIVALPKLEPEDGNGFLTNIILPFKQRNFYNLRSPSSSCILTQFYTTVARCYIFLGTNPVKYNEKLKNWITDNVIPHFNDEMFYPGLGGILRILETLKSTKMFECPQTKKSRKSGISEKGSDWPENEDTVSNAEYDEMIKKIRETQQIRRLKKQYTMKDNSFDDDPSDSPFGFDASLTRNCPSKPHKGEGLCNNENQAQHRKFVCNKSGDQNISDKELLHRNRNKNKGGGCRVKGLNKCKNRSKGQMHDEINKCIHYVDSRESTTKETTDEPETTTEIDNEETTEPSYNDKSKHNQSEDTYEKYIWYIGLFLALLLLLFALIACCCFLKSCIVKKRNRKRNSSESKSLPPKKTPPTLKKQRPSKKSINSQSINPIKKKYYGTPAFSKSPANTVDSTSTSSLECQPPRKLMPLTFSRGKPIGKSFYTNTDEKRPQPRRQPHNSDDGSSEKNKKILKDIYNKSMDDHGHYMDDEEEGTSSSLMCQIGRKCVPSPIHSRKVDKRMAGGMDKPQQIRACPSWETTFDSS